MRGAASKVVLTLYVCHVCSANCLCNRYQDPIDLRREAESIYSAFELSLCRDVVFEVCTNQYVYVVYGVKQWYDTLSLDLPTGVEGDTDRDEGREGEEEGEMYCMDKCCTSVSFRLGAGLYHMPGVRTAGSFVFPLTRTVRLPQYNRRAAFNGATPPEVSYDRFTARQQHGTNEYRLLPCLYSIDILEVDATSRSRFAHSRA